MIKLLVNVLEALLNTFYRTRLYPRFYVGDLYLFDEFQTTRVPQERRPKIENLYDVFVAIRGDELEHVKTMIACQQPDAQQTFQSPHTANRLALPESVKAAINEHTADIVQEAVEKQPVEIS